MTGVANNGIATTLSYNGVGQLTDESYAQGILALPRPHRHLRRSQLYGFVNNDPVNAYDMLL